MADLHRALNAAIDDPDFQIGPSYSCAPQSTAKGDWRRFCGTAIIVEEFHFGGRTVNLGAQKIVVDAGSHTFRGATMLPLSDRVYAPLLRGLGIAGDEMPATPSEQAMQYHELMTKLAAEGRSVLLWLDNVSAVYVFDLPPTGTTAWH